MTELRFVFCSEIPEYLRAEYLQLKSFNINKLINHMYGDRKRAYLIRFSETHANLV